MYLMLLFVLFWHISFTGVSHLVGLDLDLDSDLSTSMGCTGCSFEGLSDRIENLLYVVVTAVVGLLVFLIPFLGYKNSLEDFSMYDGVALAFPTPMYDDLWE